MRAKIGFALVVLCSVLVAPLSGRVMTDGSREEGAPFPRIACSGVFLYPDRVGGTYADGEPCSLEEIARYDLILGIHGPWQEASTWPVLRQKLAALREVNPQVIVTGQAQQVMSAYADPAAVPGAFSWRKPPADAWLLDVTGRRIPVFWPAHFMLNLTQDDVIDWVAQSCADQIKNHGYDGVYLGGMGADFPDWTLSRESPGYTIDADGDGQNDDLAELHAQWQDGKKAVCARVRELVGEEAVLLAGGTPQTDYVFEYFSGWSTGTPLLELMRGNAIWEQELEKYVHWTETPHQPNVTLYLSTPDREAPDEGRQEQLRRMRFGLAATLMGDGYFAFVTQGKQERWYPEFDAPLGFPLKPAEPRPSGAWQREFEGGVVVVNPTATDAGIAFGEEYRDFSTGTVGKQFTLSPKDGRIFVPAE